MFTHSHTFLSSHIHTHTPHSQSPIANTQFLLSFTHTLTHPKLTCIRSHTHLHILTLTHTHSYTHTHTHIPHSLVYTLTHILHTNLHIPIHSLIYNTHMFTHTHIHTPPGTTQTQRIMPKTHKCQQITLTPVDIGVPTGTLIRSLSLTHTQV